jgi:acetolactate synthase-1/3 small subunit
LNLINKFDVKELVRTGLISLERGNKTLKEYEGEL